MKRYRPVIAGLIISLAAALGGVSCLAEPTVKTEQTRSLMGTFVTVTVYAGDEAEGSEAINYTTSRARRPASTGTGIWTRRHRNSWS